MHLPEHATTNIEEYANVILGIQGPAGSGKTTAALTFPNPVYALFEKPDFSGVLQLPHLLGVKPVIMPFYDPALIDKLKQPRSGKFTDHARCFSRWVKEEAVKLTKEQTLVLDNWTRLQEYYDIINWGEPMYPTYNKSGEVDDFAPWGRKIDFSEQLSNALVGLNCNVVVIFHEVPEREQGTGRLLDKIQPLMQGKFLAKLKTYYPNFFRQHARLQKDKDGKPVEPKVVEYVWQTKSSDAFDAKCSKPQLPALIPATYSSLISQPKP